MPPAGSLTDDQLRRCRVASQQLHRPRRRSAADLVRRLVGVQAQVLGGASLALRARTDGLTSARVDRARLHDRTIVHAWAMRGTLHLIAADDYGWLVPLVTEPRISYSHRRLEQEGVPRGRVPRALRLIERMLAGEGPLTRREIAERLGRKGVHARGQAMAHLTWLAAATGLICRGPDRGTEPCFVLVRDWLGEPETLDRDAALAELAVRYLRAHGPATPADLTAWSGLRPADARLGWRGVERRLVAVETARGPMWSLRAGEGPAPPGLVRLLPEFDEYLLGWRDRSLLAPPRHRRTIDRGGGGWLDPVVLANGVAVGTWARRRGPDSITVVVDPFSSIPPATRRGVASEANDIGRFLGLRVESAIRT